MALDFELDGLGRGAHVLQAGWVEVSHGGIGLSTARSTDVRSLRQLDDQAVTVHGIGEQRARGGVAVRDIVDLFLREFAGKIIVAHGASVEREAISRISKAAFGIAIPVRTVCTLALERRLKPNLPGGDAYRLAATRQRYNLPPHEQHDALSDAIAAAELLLAQLSRMPPGTHLGAIETH
ncbi:3'-5' exonuclease [Qipengyuania sphaerica]|uniref:3'-5' exonuclease n=1 Tax=Qipengyuania sphaerica TaxID=2867243 RepID=UPI001C89D7C3|nr:3'-5' exonuclease [Qipengyuania sphaerica]MBX7541986.1 3'-5' exonuclease [Qipengyuania sphaerica]